LCSLYINQKHIYSTFLPSTQNAVFSLKDVEQNFPLAAVCINITKMVMDALQTGHLANLEGPDVGIPRI